MTNRRRLKESGKLEGKRVVKICRWCKRIIHNPKHGKKGQRQTFCSDQCVHEWKIQSDPGYVRRCLEKIEHSICQVCGTDTDALKLKLKVDAQRLAAAGDDRPWEEIWKQLSKDAGYPDPSKYSWWEAHHIKSVAEGGGLCGLEGYQTLCIKCHKEETRELRKRLRGKGPTVDRTKSEV